MFMVLPVILYVIYSIIHKLTTGVCNSNKVLHGKVVLITGGCSGIGFQMSMDMARRGARVIIAGLDPARGRDALIRIAAKTHNRDISFRQVDYESFRSVRNLAYDILQNELRLDILINNIAIAESDRGLTEDGLPKVVQVNYFSPFLLNMLLMELMKFSAPARIITTTSIAHRIGRIHPILFDRPRLTFIERHLAFADTSLANILFTMKLSRYLQRTGVTANCADPGAVSTECCRKQHFLVRLVLRMFLKSAWEGAQTAIFLAVSSQVQGISGRYFAECQLAPVAAQALDLHTANFLWNLSERRVGFTP